MILILNILKFQTDLQNQYHCEKSQCIHMHIKNGGEVYQIVTTDHLHLGDGIFSQFYFLFYNLSISTKFLTLNLYYFILFRIFKKQHFS